MKALSGVFLQHRFCWRTIFGENPSFKVNGDHFDQSLQCAVLCVIMVDN